MILLGRPTGAQEVCDRETRETRAKQEAKRTGEGGSVGEQEAAS